MQIVKLEAENVKRLKAVEITPEGSVVVISGRNGQGKSSTLDAIFLALGGRQASAQTPQPVREGENDAFVRLDLGELVVTRKWKDGKTTLKVEGKDGQLYSSPQAVLDRLVGELTFDPLAFAQQPEKEQLAILTRLVDLPFDPEVLVRKRQGIFEDRTNVGRHVKQLEGEVEGLGTEELPTERLEAQEVLAELRAAVERNNEREAWENETRKLSTRIFDLDQQIAELQAARDEAAQKRTHAEKQRNGLGDHENVDVFNEKLAGVEAHNRKVDAHEHREVKRQELENARDAYQKKTDAIAILDSMKAEAIANAKMPIEGLAFDDAGVTYDGIPFKQCSSAEQLRVSMAMAMAMNPTIRVLRITDGSLLDSDSMRIIEELAAENDYQVWLEVVDESRTAGIVIEDGEILTKD